MDKEIVISHGKLNALKDAVVCVPDMMTKAFTERKIQKAFIISGMLDHKMKLCPDIRGIIQSFKVNWEKIDRVMEAFMKRVPEAVLEFYKSGKILESFYDQRGFPVDFYLNGNQYVLTSQADNMTRSRVLYHPTILRDKGAKIKQIIGTRNSAQEKLLSNAGQLLVLNKECEAKIVDLILPESKRAYSQDHFKLVTIDILYKYSASLPSFFIKVKSLKDLTEKVILPIKGKVEDVRSGVVDKNRIIP